jgi:hypothetical protein
MATGERIREYNERIEKLAQESYPQVALLNQWLGNKPDCQRLGSTPLQLLR